MEVKSDKRYPKHSTIKNCFNKTERVKITLRELINGYEVEVYNWKNNHNKIEGKQTLINAARIEALENYTQKLITFHKMLDNKTKIDSSRKIKTENECEERIILTIKRINQYINHINVDLNNWKMERWLIPRDIEFFRKSHYLILGEEKKTELRDILKHLKMRYTDTIHND